MIKRGHKSTANGSDWRFFSELKREPKVRLTQRGAMPMRPIRRRSPTDLAPAGAAGPLADPAARAESRGTRRCLLAGNREFVSTRQVATKRAMRAFLKTADLCTAQPERVARRIVDRYYALRLYEIGAIRSSPTVPIGAS
jgi:hypothetical protein